MHMPVMDGIEATLAIRVHEQVTGDHIPIIALTAAAMKEDAEACQRAGMDGYLTKPIHQRQLQETMARFAPQKSVSETFAGTSQPNDATADQSPTISGEVADSLMSGLESIDLKAAASRMPGGKRGVRRLAEVFIGECTEIMKILRTSIPDGDPVLVARSAHTLKGSATLFFAHAVHDTAVIIESRAKENDLAAAVGDLEKLDAAVDKMLRELNEFLAAT